jgi:membrane-bound serine protease (ClpP class)
MKRAAVAILIGATLLASQAIRQPVPAASDQSPSASLVVLEGAIGPASSSYVGHALDESARQHGTLVILQLDTPGGLDTSMREIIKAILASPVPVVAYVAPGGARAASAGTYILYACHIAAMAPGTNLGAATPVSIGGDSDAEARGRADESRKTAKPEDQTPPTGSSMERKAINDAVAYIRSLAALRGRNADWAEEAVRTAASLSANEALRQHVVDLIAADVPGLLRQIDGRTVKVANQEISLRTENISWKRIEPNWRVRLLSALTHPTIAYGLLLIGIYGLLLEGYNPGAILPGVVGAIALLFALYAFQLLSVNYAGLTLIALGVGLMVTEFFVSAFGSLVIGGLIAFVIGSLLLFDSNVPGLQVARSLIVGLAVVGAFLALAIMRLAARARRRPLNTGREAMVGAIAESINDIVLTGQVRYGGELWNAQTAKPLRAGQRARIIGVEGLVLRVEPIESEMPTSPEAKERS